MNHYLSRELGRGQKLLYVAPRRREIHGTPRGSFAMLYSKGAPGIFLLLAKPNFTTRPGVIMRDRDPDTEARVSETFLQSPSNIFRLMPVCLMQMIIENLHIIDVLHFGLTCTDAWCAVWPTLWKFSLSSLGTWAGTPILCGAEGPRELGSYDPPEPPTGDQYVQGINRLLQGRASDRIRPRRRSGSLPMNSQRNGISGRPSSINPNRPAAFADDLEALDDLLVDVLNSLSNGLPNGQLYGTSQERPSRPVMGRILGPTNRHSIRHGQPNATPRLRPLERARRRVNRLYPDLQDRNHPYDNHPSQPNGVPHNRPNGIHSNERSGTAWVHADGVISTNQIYRDELRNQRYREILIEMRNMPNRANGTNATNTTNGVNGVNGTHGVNGTNGVNGVNGTNRVNGTNGVNGVNGVNGMNGVNANVPAQPSDSGPHRALIIEALPTPLVHQAWAFFKQTRDVINDCLPPDLHMPANAYIRTSAYYPADLLTIINPCPASLYRTEPGDEWILRSLTARQYVRSTAIALHPGYIKGPFIMGIGFGEVIFAMTVWTHTSRGRWAGHSLDIILLSQLEEEEEDGGDWEDVGDYVRQFIHESFRMHYGENWQEEAVKLAW
ncbi:Collagen triple helix repeat [Trichophyton rubrum]|nr:Collagen triple helix repeat [Trichophyton rubrum]